MWVLVCLFRSKVSLKPLPQKVQRYRLMSLWHFMWRLSRRWRLNTLEQMPHWNLEGSVSGRRVGSLSDRIMSGSSLARGFLIP